MIKKGFCFLLLVILASGSSAEAFSDVRSQHSVYDGVQYFLEKDHIQNTGFFRPEVAASQDLFWKLLITETGFVPASATFDTQAPTGVDPDSDMAQYLREAIRRGFYNPSQTFNAQDTISQGEALKLILKSKGIKAPRRASASFRSQVRGLNTQSSYIRYLEAAYASKIVESKDLKGFFPHRKLTRGELVRWLHNYVANGKVRKSTLDGATSASLRNNPNERSIRPNLTPSRLQNRVQSRPQTRTQTNSTQRRSSVPRNDLLESVFEQIMTKYRFADDLSKAKQEAMIEAAITAMVKEMGDKYTSYIGPEKVEEFTDSLNGEFEGIGAYVDMIKDQFTITSPITGSPAEAAGLMPGDIVTQVNGQDISEKTLREIINLVKGPAGSKVRLLVKRNNQTKEYTVTRGRITIPAITIEWKKSIPVIGLNQFNRDTGVKLQRMIAEEVLPKNPRGLVIDLRNNPGGFLNAAVKVGEIFLNRGDEIFTVEYQDNKTIYRSDQNGALRDMTNIVVLINKGSASASEIVAGMLQDYDKATIIGETSLGKGTVQEINQYPTGGVLKLTVAKWLTPNGNWINESGVKPDIEMPAQTVEERRAKIDKPLDRAIQRVLGNG